MIFKIFDEIDKIVANPIAEAAGQPVDQVRLILVFFLHYPLGWFFHYCVYGTTLRHLYNIIVGATI